MVNPNIIIAFMVALPNPDKPGLKIDPPEAEWMSLRSVLFKSEDSLSQIFCIESKEITFKDLINYDL
jgi:hypothetical protein